MADITGKTKEGFDFRIPETSVDDMELLELIGEIDGGNVAVLPKVLTALLGADQKKELYDFYRKIDGHVSIQRMLDVMAELFDSSSESKNSEPSPATSTEPKKN